MPRVRNAICEPSRSDQAAAIAATTYPYDDEAVRPAIRPVRPSPNVQIVSTQPEFLVVRQTSQAIAMIANRPIEIAISPAMNVVIVIASRMVAAAGRSSRAVRAGPAA